MTNHKFVCCKSLAMHNTSFRNGIREENANPRYNDSKRNNGAFAATVGYGHFMNARQIRYIAQNETARIPRLAYHTEPAYKNPRCPSLGDRPICMQTVRSRRRDKSPLATFYTGISIKFVRDKSCYTASGPHLKRLARASAKRATRRPRIARGQAISSAVSFIAPVIRTASYLR